MASLDPTRLAATLLQPSRQEVCFPAIFQLVKGIVRTELVEDELRSTLKNYLKQSNDTALTLMSLTVIHSIALNCSAQIRLQLAGPRWAPRLEKQLMKPQSEPVGLALAQLMLDWAYLFGPEDPLGSFSRTALHAAFPKHRPQLDAALDRRYQEHQLSSRAMQNMQAVSGAAAATGGANSSINIGGGGPPLGPSDQAASADEEIQMGMSIVGPRRAPDFVKLFLTARCITSGAQQQQQQAPESTQPRQLIRLMHAPVLAGDNAQMTGLGVKLASVASTINDMQAHASELQAQVVATEAMLKQHAGKAGNLLSSSLVELALHRGYVAAQRCSVWRGRVQELTQTKEDEREVSKLLEAIDGVNAALTMWQALTTDRVYAALGIRVGGRSVTTAAATAAATAAGISMDLLGLNELLGDLTCGEPGGRSNQQGAAPGAAQRSSGGFAPTSMPNGASGPAAVSAVAPGLVNPFAGHALPPAMSVDRGRLVLNPFDLLTPPLEPSSLAVRQSNSAVRWPSIGPASAAPAAGAIPTVQAAGAAAASAPVSRSAAQLRQPLASGAGRQPDQVLLAAHCNLPGGALSVASSSAAPAPTAVVPDAKGTWENFSFSDQQQQQQASPGYQHQSTGGSAYQQQLKGDSVQSDTQQQPSLGWEHFAGQQHFPFYGHPAAHPLAQQGLARSSASKLEHGASAPLTGASPHTAPQQYQMQQQRQQQQQPGVGPAVRVAEADVVSATTSDQIDALSSRLLQQHRHSTSTAEALIQLQQLVGTLKKEHAEAMKAMTQAFQAEISSVKAASLQKMKEVLKLAQQHSSMSPGVVADTGTQQVASAQVPGSRAAPPASLSHVLSCGSVLRDAMEVAWPPSSLGCMPAILGPPAAHVGSTGQPAQQWALSADGAAATRAGSCAYPQVPLAARTGDTQVQRDWMI